MYLVIDVQVGHAFQIQVYVMDGMTALMELMRLVVVSIKYISALYYTILYIQHQQFNHLSNNFLCCSDTIVHGTEFVGVLILCIDY